MSPILKTLGLAVLTVCVLNPKKSSAQDIPITDSEAERASIELELSMTGGDATYLNNLIYFPEFLSKTKSRSPLIDNVDTLTKIATGFGLFNIGSSTLTITKNGSYKLLRSYKKNDETHLVFRAFGDGGLSYQDITLVKVRDSIRAADIFSYELGESYAKLFSYLIEEAEAPDAHTSMSSREKYGTVFANAMSHKNYSVARSAFEKFDDVTQNDKHLSLQYIIACEHLGDKLFRKSIDHFTALFPDEPTPYLLMMRAYVETKEYTTYSRAIDKLDTLLFIDPLLNYYRGNLVMKLGDMRAGLHFYQQTFDYDPGIWQNTEKLVACKVVNNELVQANQAINLYTRTPGYRKELVEELYADYPALR